MFCANCGNQIEDNSTLCKYCGTEIGSGDSYNAKTEASSENGTVYYQQPIQNQAQYNQNQYYGQQPIQYNSGYRYNGYYNNIQRNLYEEMSVGQWVGTFLLTCIPIVGFILLIVWAVSSSSEKRVRKNWAIATIITPFIVIGIVLILSLLLGFLGALSFLMITR